MKEIIRNDSREVLKKRILNGDVLVNSVLIKNPGKSFMGELTIDIKDKKVVKEDDIKPWNKKGLINIKLETDDYIVVEKKSNLIVHPGSGNKDRTLLNIIKYMRPEIFSNFKNIRPIIVHRIDRYTTGLLILSKNEEFSKHILKQFQEAKVYKKYFGVLQGIPKNKKGMIDAPIARSKTNPILREVNSSKSSKEAITTFEVKKIKNEYSLVEFKIITGRTHQIRVHCKYINTPILNDVNYGAKKLPGFDEFGYFLHSSEIEFLDLKNKIINVKSDIPNEFKEFIE